MRIKLIILFTLFNALNEMRAQSVGINNPTPNATSILDITSTNKGLLVPRMTSAQRNAIVTPATGLLVYDTTLNLFYYFDGTIWQPLMVANLAWLLTGNAGTNPPTQFIGTTDSKSLVFKTFGTEAIRVLSNNQNVGIGETAPTSKLGVKGNTAIGLGYSNVAAPTNGLIVQGHTTIGYFAPLPADVFSSYSYAGENAVNGYAAGNGYAAYFQNNGNGPVGKFIKTNGSSGGVLQVHTNSPGNNANVLDIASNGTGNLLNISDTSTGKSIFINKMNSVTTSSLFEATNAGKGIGIYLKNTNTANINPGISVEQSGGEGINVLMKSGNTKTGLYLYHNGTGIGQSINMAPSNTNIGLQINHAGIERGIDLNLSNAGNGNDAIKIVHAGSGKGINVSVASDNSYAIWATNSTTVPAVSPSYSLASPPTSTNFLAGVGIIAAGPGHGIIANSVLDANVNTDHDGGIFIVRQSNGNTTNTAATSVGAVIDGTTYKVVGLGAVSTLVKDLNEDMRIMACPESPEVLFQDFGRGQLINGKIHITLDPIFSKNITVDTQHPLNVLIQLRGDCKGVYVTNETATGFDVIELSGGSSNAEFTWFASGNRKTEIIGGNKSDYENMRFKKMDNPLFNQKENR